MITQQRSLSGSSQSPRSPSLQPFLSVSVTDPAKMGNGVQAYISYKVITKTNLPEYQGSEKIVIRRYTDFIWLRDRLFEKYKGIFIPPLPEKSTVEKYRFSAEFIEMRRQALDIFVNRIASHHELQQSEDLRTFLQADEQTMERARLQETGIFKKKPTDLMQIFKGWYRTMSVFGSVSTEIRRKGPSSLLHSDSSVVVRPSKNMELNRAQLLVHDDATLNKFRTDHGIPEDVQIEHSGTNKNANLAEGNGDRIPVRIWLIHQVGLRFPISPIAEGVDTLMRQLELPFSASDLLHVYTVVHPKREPGTPFLKGNHYLHFRNPRHPQTRLVTNNPDKSLFLNEFAWVFGKWEFRPRDDGLFLFPMHNGHLPDNKFNEFFKNRSEECKAYIRAVNNKKASRKAGAPQRTDFSSEDFSVELEENTLLVRDPGWDEVTTLSSSNYTLFGSLDNDEEGEEEVPLLDKCKGMQLAVTLSKDVADLMEEGLKEIWDLLRASRELLPS
ncbi:sorting nexin 1 [Actinidia rufa]|uniref:Sorting nexin 1 n=1 Tax=Actinidia rufa TaxID=165716 RepID=A0A7J0GEN6_9ERIC|nr:sorting nexin 1 [Actinidia rufa]